MMRRHTRRSRTAQRSLLARHPLVIIPAMFAAIFVLLCITPVSADSNIAFSGQSRTILATSSEAAEDVLKFSTKAPRYTFFTSGNQLKQYPSSFCGGEDISSCNLFSYVESVFLTSALAFIVALVSLISGFGFWIFRSCCCGGCYASEGKCIPKERFSVEMGDGYSRKEVLIVKIGVIACLAFMVPFCVIGHLGNKNTTLAITEFGDTILGTVGEVVDTLNYISTTLSSLENQKMQFDQSDITDNLKTALEKGQQVYEQGKVIEGTALQINSYRESAILAGLILPVALMAFSAVAAIFGLAPLALISSILGFLALLVGWLTFGIHYPLPLVLSDMCTLFDGGFSNVVSQTGLGPGSGNSTDTTGGSEGASSSGGGGGNPLIAAISQCGNGTNDPFHGIKQIAIDGINYAFVQACDGFAKACNQTYTCYPNGVAQPSEQCNAMQCPVDPNAPCNDDKVFAYLQSNVTDFDMGCVTPLGEVDCTNLEHSGQTCLTGQYAPCDLTWVPFLECPELCRQKTFANSTREVAADIALLDAYKDVLYNHIFTLLNCDLITDLVSAIKLVMCVKLVNSLYYITVAEGALSAFLIPGLIFSILGIKRFNAKNKKLSEEELAAQKY